MEQIKNVEFPLHLVKEISVMLDSLIEKEVDSKVSFKHTFVDKDGKEVKSPTPKQIVDKDLKKIFDVEKTIFNPKIETSISELGVKYAKLKYFLDDMIQKNSPVLEDEKPVTE